MIEASAIAAGRKSSPRLPDSAPLRGAASGLQDREGLRSGTDGEIS